MAIEFYWLALGILMTKGKRNPGLFTYVPPHQGADVKSKLSHFARYFGMSESKLVREILLQSTIENGRLVFNPKEK